MAATVSYEQLVAAATNGDAAAFSAVAERHRSELQMHAYRMLGSLEDAQDAVQAYAARAGQSEEDYVRQIGPLVTPEIAGAALLELVQADAGAVAPAYLLTGAGLQALPAH